MSNLERMQARTAPEVMLPKEQEQEARDLVEAVMENMDRRDRERMFDFLRGVRFAQTLNTTQAAGMPGA